MKTLIFGATGYVGGNLVARLAADGPVTGFARTEEGAAAVASVGGTPLVGTLDDIDTISDALASHDRIIWAAQLMLEPEQEFIARLIDLLSGTDKTLVFTSGTGVLSERTDGNWSENTFAEDDPFVPRDFIAMRVETENMVRRAGVGGLRTIVVRPPAIWGNGGKSLVTEIYRSVNRTGSACYMGLGLNCYSNVHVLDLVELYALALEKAPSGALYHAVAGELNFRVMAEAVARHLGVATKSLDYGEAREVFGPSSTAIVFAACSRTHSPRARSELGWRPHPDRLDAFEDCIDPVHLEASTKLGSWVADAERSAQN